MTREEIAKEIKSCYSCKWLEYWEEESFESNDSEGWYCEKREDAYQHYNFPHKRKLRCFEG